jgi:deoxyribonuclease-4
MEFVRGVKMSPALAAKVGELARRLDVKISAHGPYWVSLISKDAVKARKSVEFVLQTARAVNHAGGERVVFHPGYYHEFSREQAYAEMKKAFREILEKVRQEKLNVVIAPETTGGRMEFGTLEELVSLSEEFGIERVNPTIDFAHLHCRDGKGSIKNKEDYAKIFDYLEKRLGKKAVQTLHSHFTGVAFSEKGEKHHLTIDSNQPPFKPLAELLVEQGYSGTIISESPTIEKDALIMKKVYEKILEK